MSRFYDDNDTNYSSDEQMELDLDDDYTERKLMSYYEDEEETIVRVKVIMTRDGVESLDFDE